MELRRLLAGLETTTIYNRRQLEIKGLAYDSRRVAPGYLFVALPGLKTDGRRFIPQALEKGAVGIVAESPPPAAYRDLLWIEVPHARQALAQLSANWWNHPGEKLHLCGVTGTNGKTTTAFYLQHLFTSAGIKTGVVGTLGVRGVGFSQTTRHTTPESLELQGYLAQLVNTGHKAAVLEVSSHALDQERTAGLKFKAALFTNLTQDHLDYHKTLEAYFQSKQKLFRQLEPEALAVLNADSPYSPKLAAVTPARVVTAGFTADADYRLELLPAEGGQTQLRLIAPRTSMEFRTNALGKYNLQNLVLAMVAFLELEGAPGVIHAAANNLPTVPGRMERVPVPAPYTVVVDYAHTPDAMERVLETLRAQFPQAVLTVVFGAGGDRDRTKRPLMGAAACRYADRVIVTSDNPRSEDPEAIIADILPGCSGHTSVIQEPDRKKAIHRALLEGTDGAVIAILGKGHETYQEIRGHRYPFNDVAVVKKFFENAGVSQ